MQHRTCSKCGESKPETEEYFRKRGHPCRGGLRPDCRECSRQRDRQYYRDNPETFRQYRQANAERRAAYMREYWPQYMATEHGRAVAMSSVRRWKKTEAGRASGREMAQRRRARERGVVQDLTEDEWQACLAAFDHACAYCGQAPDPTLTQDHVLPITSGGGHTATNVVPACVSCNSRKHTSLLDEWYPAQPFYRPDRHARIVAYLGAAADGQR